MRNALILLAVVALLILAVGALNNGTAFDVDYVAGTASAVSLLWVSAVIAALVFVAGLAAAWFAQAAMTGSRRKLEAELQTTYERLREAEAHAARPAPVAPAAAVEAVVAAAVAEREQQATVVETAEVTAVADEAATVVDDAAVTVVESGEAATVVAGDEPAGGEPAEPAVEEPAAEPVAGEQTAVTMTGPPPADASSEARTDEGAEAEPAADDAGQPGQPSS